MSFLEDIVELIFSIAERLIENKNKKGKRAKNFLIMKNILYAYRKIKKKDSFHFTENTKKISALPANFAVIVKNSGAL